MRRALVVLGIAVTLYSLWALLLFSQQRRMMYVAWGAPVVGLPAMPDDGVATWIEAPGAKAEAWYLAPAAGTPEPFGAVIFAHGNGETIDAWPRELQKFRELGFAVLLVEYPGYGRSSGDPTETSIRGVFLGAYDWLRSQPGVDPQRILGFGRSLGGGAICGLLRERPVAGVVLLSAFSSARIFAARYGLPSFLVRDPFDNVAALRGYGGPVLLLHGRQDPLVPFAVTQALLGANARATLRAYDCGHECWDPERFPLWQDLGDFLRRNSLLRPLAVR